MEVKLHREQGDGRVRDNGAWRGTRTMETRRCACALAGRNWVRWLVNPGRRQAGMARGGAGNAVRVDTHEPGAHGARERRRI